MHFVLVDMKRTSSFEGKRQISWFDIWRSRFLFNDCTWALYIWWI